MEYGYFGSSTSLLELMADSRDVMLWSQNREVSCNIQYGRKDMTMSVEKGQPPKVLT